VAGVGVADRPQVLVVATDECGAAANPAGNLQDGAVDRMAESNHRFCLVEILPCEKIGGETSKGALGRNEDGARVLPAAGQIEQPEQNARRAHPQEFVEVAGHALAVVHGSDLCPTQHRHIGMPRIAEAHDSFPAFEQGAYEIGWRQSQRPKDFPGSCHSSFAPAFVHAVRTGAGFGASIYWIWLQEPNRHFFPIALDDPPPRTTPARSVGNIAMPPARGTFCRPRR